MAVVLRLSRAGTHKAPFYHVVATDSRKPRDGRYLEDVGQYDPTQSPNPPAAQGGPRRFLAQGRRQAEPHRRQADQAGQGRGPGSGQGLAKNRAAMRDLLLWLARELVEQRDAVRVDAIDRERTVVLELAVDPSDLGRVIGRGGKTAKAIRTVVDAAARREGRRAVVDILD